MYRKKTTCSLYKNSVCNSQYVSHITILDLIAQKETLTIKKCEAELSSPYESMGLTPPIVYYRSLL